jgi:hypothetical protein
MTSFSPLRFDAFDMDLCLPQMDWGKANQPRKTLFVMTTTKP